jgi:anti-sigma factor RsiW
MPPLSDEDRENLVAYLDGELDEATARSIEARINVDPQVRAEVESLRQAWEMLEFLPRPEPSSNFTNRTLERLAVHRPHSTMTMTRPTLGARWAVRLGWTAVLALAVVGGFALALWLWPRPTVPDAGLIDAVLTEDLRVIENKDLYDHIEDLDFLKRLDHTELFDDDQP